MPKNSRIKADDGRTFGTVVARQLQASEVGVGLGRLNGNGSDGRPVVRMVIPDNGRGPKDNYPHVPGQPELHLYAPKTGECRFLDQRGKRCAEDHRTGAIADFTVEEDDDVGDAPPRFDDADETAAPVTEPGNGQ